LESLLNQTSSIISKTGFQRSLASDNFKTEVDSDRFLRKGKIFAGEFQIGQVPAKPEWSQIQNELRDFWSIDINVQNNKKIDA